MQTSDDRTRARRAELILRQVDALPTLSNVAARLMRLGGDEDARISDIVALIESDPALTARLLSLCRKAALGLGDKVTTVERAVVLLGLEQVRSLALSVQMLECAQRLSPGRAEQPIRIIDRVGFWRHSIAVACCAEQICRIHKKTGVRPQEAFVGGLVHDLGKLALSLVLPKAYDRVLERAELRGGNIADHERSVIGLDHHTAGKRLAQHWELPDALRDCMWLHGQRPGMLPEMEHAALIRVVWAADLLVRGLHLGWSGNEAGLPEADDLLVEAGFDMDRIRKVQPMVHKSAADRCEVLGIESETTSQMLLESVMGANRRLGVLLRGQEARARVAVRRARMLDAIADFCRRIAGSDSVIDVLDHVAASAFQLGDPTRPCCAVIHENGPNEDWLVIRGGSPTRHMLVAPPKGHDGQLVRLRDVAVELGQASPGAWPAWVEHTLRPEGPITVLNIARDAWGTSVLVHDDAGRPSSGDQASDALIAAWQSAVAASSRVERGMRLSEELADANRVLSETQRQLAEARSMARLGELTAGAAHELNNPLTVISGRAQRLARLVDGESRDCARSIVEASSQLTGLIRRLHLIARPPKLRPERTVVGDLLRAAVARACDRFELNAQTKCAVEIEIISSVDDISAHLDRELVTEMLAEVVMNALEAKPHTRITVRAETDRLDGRLCFAVEDDGIGMTRHAMTHALDPFFSEKTAGRQPGLGLPTALRIARLHEGGIQIERSDATGSCVVVWLGRWRDTTSLAA